MVSPPPPTRRSGGLAGGVFLAIGLIAGLVIGTLYREPIIGLAAGFAFGLAMIALIWLLDRR